ncbi:hypothetical protein [Helicobacter ailurogastricus]|uniref:Uncharacterized protein n=1 Tax=Helicobacter ailurogastricus TaxID=1578720 RepID=A0A0K2XEB1_9HELI|nr:hypothetical protein [Helicobacter ailurogastricus]CRF41701.1 hypothetical protein HAL011_15090 [Helicobacter ailurogastricus]CRF42853.1 hypothetical protein HAL013_10630 [Helicobacter ailurogastricus]CRF44421.1 hypothetical protein HAL09_10030 [Helicobacter ailurogastricus]CRF52655.1 hypothetical protein HAL07_11200 [Helicobacter ailurogastricus]
MPAPFLHAYQHRGRLFCCDAGFREQARGQAGFLSNLALAFSGAVALQTLGRLGFTINPLVGTILSTILSILPGIFPNSYRASLCYAQRLQKRSKHAPAP